MSFTSVHRIIEAIGRSHRDMAPDIGDVAEWCFGAIKRAGVYESFVESVGMSLDVVNGYVKTPCNMIRLLSVKENCSGCGSVSYTQAKAGIRIRSSQTTVHVTALLMPVDDDGYPLIHINLEDVCYWYCLEKMLIDPWLNGKLPDSKYNQVLDNVTTEIHRAKASMANTTRDEMDSVVRSVRAMWVGPRFTGRG